MKTLDQFFPKVVNTLPEGSYILCLDDNTDMYFAKYESGSLQYWDLDNGNNDVYYFGDLVTEEDMSSAINYTFGTYDLNKCYIATEEEVGNMILAYYGLNVRCVANNNTRKGRVVKKSTSKAKS